MLVTPYDVQDKPPLQGFKQNNGGSIGSANVKTKNSDFQYRNKFRSGIYATVLFILLSQKVSYKILDLVIKVFYNRIDIIDSDDTPQFIGTIIMALLVGIIIFLF
jgi:hypothetical protein